MRLRSFERPRYACAKSRIILVLAVMLVASGCHGRDANDDVLVTVNGDPLTRADVDADLKARDLPLGIVGRRVPPALLSAMIDRRLLAERARAEGLDEEPGYAALVARSEETLLAQRLLAKWRSSIPAPTREEAQAFADSNPQAFADRKVYLVREVQTASKPAEDAALADLPSLEAVEESLRNHDRPFRRSSASLDTGTLDVTAARRLARSAVGVPFEDRRGRILIVRAVFSSQAAPVTGDAALSIAEEMIRRQSYEAFVRRELQALRSHATLARASSPS